MRQYYYIADIDHSSQYLNGWVHCVRGINAEDAKKKYSKEYFEKFGNYPIAVSVKRTSKATFLDINYR